MMPWSYHAGWRLSCWNEQGNSEVDVMEVDGFIGKLKK